MARRRSAIRCSYSTQDFWASGNEPQASQYREIAEELARAKVSCSP